MNRTDVHICGGRNVDCEAALDLANTEITQLQAKVAHLVDEKLAVSAGAHLAKVVLDAAEAWREAGRGLWTDETPEQLRATDDRLTAAVDAWVKARRAGEAGQ